MSRTRSDQFARRTPFKFAPLLLKRSASTSTFYCRDEDPTVASTHGYFFSTVVNTDIVNRFLQPQGKIDPQSFPSIYSLNEFDESAGRLTPLRLTTSAPAILITKFLMSMPSS